MLFAEKESNIIELFQKLRKKEISLFPLSFANLKICKSVYLPKRWERWTDSSGKDMPPPDFYNDREGLMMEVMRVDDHGFKKNGKIINPCLAREHKIERELKESGLFGENTDNLQFLINAVTGLPTDEDHNYNYYSSNFQRIVNDHKSKIQNYKKNHPNYKMVFFVFDESSAYTLMQEVPYDRKAGDIGIGKIHHWYEDQKFIEVFQNSEIDYLIWYTPYKFINVIYGSYTFPTACVFDCKKINYKLEKYDPAKMVSADV